MSSYNLKMASSQLGKRYRDAYQVLRVLIGLAGLVKFGGILIGILVIFAGLLSGEATAVGAGFVAGGIIALVAYIWGILLAAGPEVGQAVLDIAINTSPFLSEQEKAQAMHLAK